MSPPGRPQGEDRSEPLEGTSVSQSRSQAPLPRSVAASKPDDADLGTRILLVEQRLILREENLRRTTHQITGRVQAALRPARLLWPLAGLAAVAGAGFGLYSLWRGRREPAGAAVGPPSPGVAAHAVPGVSWLRLLGLAWPLLPQGWRARVSPATASAVMALGLPMLESLLARRHAAKLQTMAVVDLSRYAGTWYVVASLPGHGLAEAAGAAAQAAQADQPDQADQAAQTPPTAPRWHYTLRRDGLIDLASDAATDAVVHPVPGRGGAELRVTRWPEWLHLLPWAWQDQWLLHIDDDYSEAVLGSPRRDALWLLSRQPRLAEPRLTALVQLAQDRGFAVQRLRFHGAG